MLRLAQASKEVELAAGAFGVKLQYLDVRDSNDVETAFRAATKGRADAVLVLPGAVLNSQRKQIADLAVKSRLPAIFPFPEYVEAGGLMSYGASFTDLYRRRYLCGQDPQRRQARLSTGGTAEEVRVGDQSQDRRADRLNNPGVCAVSGG
jgi:hypothetical protein